MTRPETDELARWLAAEQAGRLDEADQWFAAVAARHLPKVPEPAFLAARVMAALPEWGAARRRSALLDPAGAGWGRAAVALAVAMLGFGLATAPPGDLPGLLARSVEAAARLAVSLLASASAAVRVVGAFWAVLIDLGRAATLVATTGAAPALIAANALLACLAFAGLSRLLSPREESL